MWRVRGSRGRIPRLLLAALVALLCSAAPAGAALGPLAPPNPYTAANGAATMHGDAGSSDVSPFPGPGLGAQSVRVATLGAACPTILQGADGIPIALCTAILDRKPTVYELNPDTGLPVASLALPASGNLFGGVYAYLDNNDKLVLFDADGNLVRIGHHDKQAVDRRVDPRRADRRRRDRPGLAGPRVVRDRRGRHGLRRPGHPAGQDHHLGRRDRARGQLDLLGARRRRGRHRPRALPPARQRHRQHPARPLARALRPRPRAQARPARPRHRRDADVLRPPRRRPLPGDHRQRGRPPSTCSSTTPRAARRPPRSAPSPC